MYDLANSLLAERNLPPLDMKDVYRVEGTAAGHVDYTRKFALYVAELVRDKFDCTVRGGKEIQA